MSALADKLLELAPDAETLRDDDELIMVWGLRSLAMLTQCTHKPADGEPVHWHGVLFGGTISIRSTGVDAEDAYTNLYTRCRELIDALSTDASERSPKETAGRPGAEDVPDYHL